MVNGISTLFYSLEMDWVLLWLTAKLLGYRTTTFRLGLAATLGVLPTLWVLLRQNLYAVPWELGLVWPMAMLAVAMGGLPRRFWLKAFVLFLAMSFLAGGLFSAGLGWLKLYTPGVPILDWMVLVPPVLVAFGVWVPKRRVRQMVGRDAYGEIALELDHRIRRLSVLWDSGNELMESLEHRPVVIVELSQMLDWLPEELWAWVLSPNPGEPARVPEAWEGRVGLVTFHTIAGEGRLPFVFVDQAWGRYLDQWSPMVPLAVGFSTDTMNRDGSYRALASPQSLIHCPNERVGA